MLEPTIELVEYSCRIRTLADPRIISQKLRPCHSIAGFRPAWSVAPDRIRGPAHASRGRCRASRCPTAIRRAAGNRFTSPKRAPCSASSGRENRTRSTPWLSTRSMPVSMTGTIGRVEVITSVQRQRWSAAEKAAIALREVWPCHFVSFAETWQSSYFPSPRTRPDLCATSSARKAGLLRKYRFASRCGSMAIRKTHSSPNLCSHDGARRTRPA
jgi:hypothetical protein